MALSENLVRFLPWVPIVLPALVAVLFFVVRRPAISGRGIAVSLVVVMLFSWVLRHQTREARREYAVPVALVAAAVLLGRYFYHQRLAPKLAPITAAFKGGDYESALRMCDDFPVRSAATREFYRGAALYHLRRLEQAESSLRSSLTMQADTRGQSLVLSQLGRVLMEQGRTEEAIHNFERSVELNPSRGGALRGQAEVYLRGKFELERALELAQRAVNTDRQQPPNLRVLSLSSSSAVLAWALAVNGRASEARQSVQEALAQLQPDIVPQLAEDHYLAGRALLALGERDGAAQDFRKASEVEPNGNFGILARQELARMG